MSGGAKQRRGHSRPPPTVPRPTLIFRSILSLVAMSSALLAAACSGAPETQAEATREDLSVVAQAKHKDVMRGVLTHGVLTPIAIVEQQGPDSTPYDLDLVKTKVAGAEAGVLAAFPSSEFWARGDFTRRDTGRTIGGSKIYEDVLVATRVATVTKDNASGQGILRKQSNGSFLVEVKVGSDDSGSFNLDVTDVPSVEALVGKHVHVDGLLVRELTGVVQRKYFVSSDLMVVTRIRP